MITTTATVTTDLDGRLTIDSTVTVDGSTYPIPARVASPLGGTTALAPLRIAAALADLGLRPIPGYRDSALRGVGTYAFLVTPL